MSGSKRSLSESQRRKKIARFETAAEAERYVGSLGEANAFNPVPTQAQKALESLRSEAKAAAQSLGAAGDTLSAGNLEDLPSLVEQAKKKTKFQEDKDVVDRLANRIDARRNAILSRLRAPGRSGRIIAGGS
jgi:hypothetical protein